METNSNPGRLGGVWRVGKKILKWGGGGLVALLVVATAVTLVREHRTWDAPMPALVASKDPAVIARGRYLVKGPAHCEGCHAPEGAAATDGDVALVGGVDFKLPLGIIRSRNLTSDRETGLGAVSDGAIARALRYGVDRDGHALAPFMPFADLSDDDVVAILSYLRAQPAVRNEVVRRELNPLGHVVAAFLLKPPGPTKPIAATAPEGPSLERGRYLAESVGNCAGCHTARDLRTGAFTGPRFAGGMTFTSKTDAKVTLVSPNLTPDATTGRLATWNEEVFVARFKTGRGAEGTHMPWEAFARMTDDDLRSLWRFLSALPPVQHDTGPTVRGPSIVADGS